MEDLSGKQLGPYQIVAPLGEGGMAAVFKAFHPAMDRYVALKVLPQQFARDPQFVARFRQEARLVARLQHPHILPVHDFGESDGYTYLTMPLVGGGTLKDLLTGRPLPLPRIQVILHELGDALDYAHAQGVVHRDIKPSNVLLDERGHCLLTDFGIAKMVEATARLTTTGGIIGTPIYMSPEQGRGGTVDARSDLYALGVMLYEMATGRPPFDAETPLAVIFKHIQDPLPLPRTVNPQVPEALERVILKALAKSPEDRFQTAGALVEALAPLSPSPSARPPGTAVSPQLFSRAPLLVGSVIALVGLGLLGVLAALMLVRGFGPDPNLRSTAQPSEVLVALEATATPGLQATSPPETAETSLIPTDVGAPPTQTPFANTPIAPTAGAAATASPAPSSTPLPATATCAPPQYYGDLSRSLPALGCATSATTSDFTYQPFQGGTLIWQKSPSPPTIFALFGSGAWASQADPGGPAGPACPEAEQTGGLGPIFGFGTLWCQNASWRQQLGNPTGGEGAAGGQAVQHFEQGFILSVGDGRILVFYSSGAWQTR